jgi:hypothetical protein
MPSPFVVILDACVLYPMSLRDTLLTAGTFDLYQIRWTDQILEEATRNLRKDGRQTEKQAKKFITTIKSVFPEALIPPKKYQYLIPTMKNQEKDRHVLAAAVSCAAQVIVTSNLKDFPKAVLDDLDIEAQSPDTFLIHQFNLHPTSIVNAIKTQAANLKNPPKTPLEVLESLKIHAPNFVEKIQSLI